MQFQTARHPPHVTAFLNFGQCHGIMWQLRRLFMGQDTMPQDRRDIGQRHDAVQFGQAVRHDSTSHAFPNSCINDELHPLTLPSRIRSKNPE
jgi:hypothetical protein